MNGNHMASRGGRLVLLHGGFAVLKRNPLAIDRKVFFQAGVAMIESN